MKTVVIQTSRDKIRGTFDLVTIMVPDNYVEVKEKYRVGITSPRIAAKPRTGSRLRASKLRHMRLRYKYGTVRSNRVARRIAKSGG